MGFGSKLGSWISRASHEWRDIYGKLFMPRGPPRTLTRKDDMLALDNTAFISEGKWTAEIVISIFNRKDLRRWHLFEQEVLGRIRISRERVKWSRVEYFLSIVSPNVDVVLREAGGGPAFTVGPTQYNGIMAPEVALPTGEKVWAQNQTTVFEIVPPNDFPDHPSFTTVFAEEVGWDIDDTIKVTDVLNQEQLLKHTFLDEEGIPVQGMSELYNSLMTRLNNPTVFYLSASPWQLYPYLREFTKTNYPFGQLILREMSYTELSSFIDNLTLGTLEFKQREMDKLHRWLPNKQFLCIGDSTQTDPEVYGTMHVNTSNLTDGRYRKYPGWIKAIWIRVLSGVNPEREKEKNASERFQTAFEGIPPEAWRTFTHPSELMNIPIV